MANMTMTRPDVTHWLGRTFSGAVHLPGDEGYDAHRRPLAPTLDPRPALVAEATNIADVHAAVVAARDYDVPFAVQATGHGTHVPCDDGLLLKTTSMNTVQVDPHRQVAHVGPGAVWGDVLAAASAYGLAPLSGSSNSVGVTGFTLGGGMGWLGRLYGLAADSVLSAEVVTAEGRLVRADAYENADLFWALRGGGGSFGVVTSLEFRLYPVTEVYGGISYFAPERADETLAAYGDWARGAPDAMSTAIVLTTVDGRRVLGIKAMYAGGADEAERLLRPLRAAAGPALVDGYRSMRYADAAMGGTPARYLDFFPDLPDAVIKRLVDTAGAVDGAGANVEVRHWGGALARPGADGGPAGRNTAEFSVIVDAPTPHVVNGLRPYGIGGAFLNFLSDTSRTAQAYTASDYARLRTVKRAYDPENVFGVGHSILPAA